MAKSSPKKAAPAKPSATSAAPPAFDPLEGGPTTAAETAPATGAAFKVRAIAMGYYGEKRRRIGDVFMVEPKAFSRKWMQVVSARTPESETGPNEQLRREHDAIVGGKTKRVNADVIGD